MDTSRSIDLARAGEPVPPGPAPEPPNPPAPPTPVPEPPPHPDPPPVPTAIVRSALEVASRIAADAERRW